MDEPREVAAKLDAHRKRTGLTYEQVGRELHARLGAYTPTNETIRLYHLPDRAPKKLDLVVLLALADVYGTTLRFLSEPAADLLSDLGKRATGWLSRKAIAA